MDGGRTLNLNLMQCPVGVLGGGSVRQWSRLAARGGSSLPGLLTGPRGDATNRLTTLTAKAVANWRNMQFEIKYMSYFIFSTKVLFILIFEGF